MSAGAAMMENDSRGVTPSVAKGKICDMIKEWQTKTAHPFISFEYFPPKTPEGVEKLHKVIDVMSKQDPLFMDFTWGAGGTTSDLTLDLSKESQTRHNVMVNMHLTCTNQGKEMCDYGLTEAKKNGIWCAHAAASCHTHPSHRAASPIARRAKRHQIHLLCMFCLRWRAQQHCRTPR